MSGPVTKKRPLWREPHGALPNTLAIAYGLLGQIVSIGLMAQEGWLSFVLGLVLCAHSLVICAYLIHEAAHMTLFKSRENNQKLGEMLLWVVGAAYASFDRVRHMHLRHHQDRADVSCFSYQAFLNRRPKWVRRLVVGLETCYIPAVELIMHAQVIVRPFTEPALRAYRRRVILVALSRMVFFWGLFSLSPWVLLGYAIAYLLMLQALFLADAFAHTYESYFVDDPHQSVPREGRDRVYDEAHTYSNLISERFPWLNLLNLNFGYHTAHHEKASKAWHDLPAFHRELYGASSFKQVLPYRELWKTIHLNRSKRVFVEDYGDVRDTNDAELGRGRADDFVGAHGVSFLSIV